MTKTKKIRLLIADDHEVVRSGLRSLVAGTEIEVVGEATTGEEAVRLALSENPHVVILDIRMPDGDGLASLTRIKAEKPELAVVLLSTYDNPTYISRACALGAQGYLLKGLTRDELLSAIRSVAGGGEAWSRDDVRRMAANKAPIRIEALGDVPLTARESEVLRQLAYGLTNKEIGQALGISYETVKEHVQNMLRKIGVSDRTQAAVWAVRHGLV